MWESGLSGLPMFMTVTWRLSVQVGDLVAYVKDYHTDQGIGIVVRTSPMYAFVKWSSVPGGPFIADKKHLRLISESR